jgi:transposase
LPIAEALVLALVIVETEPGTDAGSGLGDCRISVKVDLLVLEAAPQPLDKDVVHAPAFAVHADHDAMPRQAAGKIVAGELAALIGTKDLRPAIERERFLERLDTEIGAERVGGLDTELLKRAFLGWLRGERDHCSMAAIPTIEEEDGRRPHRERENLVAERTRIINRMKGCLARLGIRGFKPTRQRTTKLLPTLRTPEGTPSPPNALAEMGRDLAQLHFVEGQIREIETARLERLDQAPTEKSHAMVLALARIIGVGVETADMLVREVLSRNLRDRRAVARYAGLTGTGRERFESREKGLAKAGNARVRRGMIQLAWRFLMFQKESALAQWYRARTVDARQGMRKSLIVAMARKLLIELWRFVTTGEMPVGVAMRPA